MTALSSQPTVILTGPFGSGKTEVAIAYARAAHAAGRRVVLIDADIITPYFRVGDYRDILEGEGIPVIAASGALASFELPAVPPQLRHALAPSDTHLVLDAGGDPAGARFLAGYAEEITARGYDMWLVANPFRPATPDADSLVAAAHHLADQSGLRFTGLVANPHLGPLTTPADLLRGLAPIQQAASQLGLPVVLLAVAASLAAAPLPPDLPLLPLTLTLRPPW